MDMLISFMEDKKEQAVDYIRELNDHGVDPEGFFYRARLLARCDETLEALNALQRAVRGGFLVRRGVPGRRLPRTGTRNCVISKSVERSRNTSG
jgi:hypothetical protein